MSNNVVFEVQVTEKGLKIVQKGVDDLNKSVSQSTKVKKEAAVASGELNYKLNQGVTGSSSAARSFSKLNQAIGHGPNGLVGAYATLAANTFAVVAAFSALREAAGVEQVLRGLEVQGAKTGRTLSIAAANLREVTGAAISTADALKATAQVTSAGFNTKELEQLGNVATNAALALGRSIPDALERITRGVTKLEPELLDELGIMTKLTEATNAYALAHNKSATSLSSFEKRQAFLNAVVAEGELKFKGIKDEIGTNPYDKLAASFDNLVKKILSFANVIGKVFAELGALNEGVLFGAVLLFASTISKQLIPALQTLGDASRRRSAQLLEEASKNREAAAASLAKAKADREQSLASARNLQITAQYPKKFQEVIGAIKEGTVASNEFQVAQTSLARAISAREGQLKGRYAGTDMEAAKTKEIAALKETQVWLSNLQAEEEKYKNTVIRTTEASRSARLKELSATMGARAQISAAQALELAGNGEVLKSWDALTLSVRQYGRAVALARADGAGAITGFTKAADAAKVAAFGIGTGIKAAGAAFINFLPQLGLIAIGLSLAQEAYKKLFETKADEKRAKALENFGTIVEHTNEKLEQLLKTEQSIAAFAAVTTQKLQLQANATTELADAALEAARQFKDSIEKEKNEASLFEALVGTPEDFASYMTGIAKDSKFVQPFADELDKQSKALEYNPFFLGLGKEVLVLYNSIVPDSMSTLDKQTVLLAKSTEQLSEVMDKELVGSLIKAYGGLDKIAKNPALQAAFIQKAGDTYKGLATNVKDLEEAFKQAETSAADFINSIVPKTSYDNVLKSFQGINTAIDTLSSTSTVNDKDFLGLVTGIGPNAQKFLAPVIQAKLDQARAEQQIVAQLEQQEQLGIQLSYDQFKRLNDAKAMIVVLGQQRQAFIDAVRAVEDQLRVLQSQDRLLKSQITTLQTILSTNEKAYAVGAAGTLLRIKREEEINSLQVKQLQLQIDLQKTLINQAKSKLELINLDKLLSESEARRFDRELDTQATILQGLITQRKLALDTAKEAGKTNPAAAADLEILTEALGKVQASSEIIKGQLADRAQERQLTNEIRDASDAILALQENINAISQKNLSEQEKLALAAGAELKVRQQIEETYQNNTKAVKNLNRQQEKLNDLIAGATQTPLYRIKDVLNDAAVDITDISNKATADIDTITQSIKELRGSIATAKSKGLKEEAAALEYQVGVQDKLLQSKILQRDIDIQTVEVNRNIAILEEAIIDARTEGLDLQKKGLEVLNAYYDQRQKALEQEQELYTLRKETAAIKSGVAIGERAQKAIEYKALQEQANLAKEQLELRKTGIELEYGLLEAQRLMLMDELRIKSKLLEAQASLIRKSDPTGAGNLDVIVNQMEAVLANIGSKSYEQVKQMALDSADREVEILQARADKARAEWMNIGKSSTQLDKVRQGIGDAVTVMEAIISGKTKVEPAKIVNPIIPPMQKLTTTLDITNIRISDLIGVLKGRLESTKPDPSIAAGVATGVEKLGERMAGKITSTFNSPRDYGKHRALDIANPEGTPVPSTMSGRVKFAGNTHGNYGNLVIIEDAISKIETRYAHLSKILVQTGNTVSKGDVLGNVGHTGRATGPHLHYEVRVNGEKIDPLSTKPLTVNILAKAAPVATAKSGIGTPPIVGDRSEIPESNYEDIVLTANKLPTKIDESKKSLENLGLSGRETFEILNTYAESTFETFRALGPQGELVVAVLQGINTMTNAMFTFVDSVKDGGVSVENLGALASAAISSIQNITSAAANARIANIDREIAAEQKRDGKSAESVAKLASMEKKKDEIAKKQFNLNKKLMMAQAVIATATGIAMALSAAPPPANFILAGLVAALGAAQLAIISGSSYQSANSSAPSAATPSSLSIGKRGSTVDLAQGPNANAGGEIGYLRGNRGFGDNASNYRTIGSAYGGELMRGYGNRGFAVGEKGPEVINPETPITVTPVNDTNAGQPMNATINIQALDASGVEKILVEQKGNIIQMLRDAANASGQPFMENVNTNVYTRPNVNKL